MAKNSEPVSVVTSGAGFLGSHLRWKNFSAASSMMCGNLQNGIGSTMTFAWSARAIGTWNDRR